MSSCRKTASIDSGCVACGCCVKACRLKAVAIHRGVRAAVDTQACVGCGCCERACPAGVVVLTAREGAVHEEALV